MRRADYKEGIYVGYRWFQANHITPRFPFGYGLSYTTFSHEFLSFKQCGDKLVFSFLVQNTGEKYEGKDVVEIYASKPAQKVNQSEKELVGFAKTKNLEPGEKQVVTIEVQLRDMVTYVEEMGGEYLLSGNYIFWEGKSSEELEQIAVGIISEDYLVKKTNRIESCNFSLEEKIYTSQIEEKQDLASIVIETGVLATRVVDDTKEDEEPSEFVKTI